MKLLIFTQAIDTNDEILGFFHGWATRFSKEFEFMDIVCLKKGENDLPKNVRVHSLGKENGRSKLKYIFNVYRYVFSIKYDAVFVHMNEEYVLLCGLLWWLIGKKVVLWRNFKTGTWRTRLAGKLSTIVCYTSPESFTAQFKNSVQMPVGVDTDFFKPAVMPTPPNTVLFFGRLDAVKRAELFVEALKLIDVPFSAKIYGSPTYPGLSYEEDIKKLAEPLVNKGVLNIYPGTTHGQSRDLFQGSAVYVNVTPSGSFDKMLVEAMACGAIIVCTNDALREILPNECFGGDSAESVAKSIKWAMSLSDEEKRKIIDGSIKYVEENHSLSLLSARLKGLF